MSEVFEAPVLSRPVKYFLCNECGFLCTEEPYWLDKAYEEPINTSDTGMLTRNIRLAKLTTLIILLFFNKTGNFIDYAGGYGVLVRLLRDWGFGFRWHAKYSKNIFARGFEQDPNQCAENIELITCFEAFEHFLDPRAQLDEMLECAPSILFSTEILPDGPPPIDSWWYYGTEHGQHISFYSLKSLESLATQKGLYFFSNGRNSHLFSRKKLPRMLVEAALKTNGLLDVSGIARMLLGSKTQSDGAFLANSRDE